jgi:DNA-binding NarL/FixJ family response regulator
MEANFITSPALLLVDDNSALLKILVEILQANYCIVAALTDGSCVLDQINTLRPDVIILDISLGDLTGFDIAKRLKDNSCTAKIIFLTIHEDIDFVTAAFNIGVRGYVFKSRVTEDLTRAITVVFSGGQFTSIHPIQL